MADVVDHPASDVRKTRLALLWMNLTAEPLIVLYTLTPVFLRKEFGASLFEISLFLMLRPVLSIFSFYWSAYLKTGKERLVINCVGASILAYLPLLFFPWVNQFWFLLLALAAYQLFSKAALPSFIEVLKRKLPKIFREKTFSLFFIVSFIESGILGVFLGGMLDAHAVDWKVLFSFAAFLGMSGLLFFSFLKPPSASQEEQVQPPKETPRSLLQPWKESFQLMKDNPEFCRFQTIFMVGGSALMLMLPAIPCFFADTLQLSYRSMTTARFIFMAIGVASSSCLWAKGLSHISLQKLTVWVLFGFGLFSLALLMAQFDVWFLYLAYLLYGVAQAGSHLIWNLGGTFFAPDKDSSPYTRTNLLMNALRGAVMPLLGGLLCQLFGPVTVLCLGGFLCLYGAQRFWRALKQKSLQSV